MSKRLIPYITMDGNAKEAIEFYEEALDAQLLFIQTFGEMPENPDFPIPAESRNVWDMLPLKWVRQSSCFLIPFPDHRLAAGIR